MGGGGGGGGGVTTDVLEPTTSRAPLADAPPPRPRILLERAAAVGALIGSLSEHSEQVRDPGVVKPYCRVLGNAGRPGPRCCASPPPFSAALSAFSFRASLPVHIEKDTLAHEGNKGKEALLRAHICTLYKKS